MYSATSPNLTTRHSLGKGPISVIWKPSGRSSVFATECPEATASTSVRAVFSVVENPFLFIAPQDLQYLIQRAVGFGAVLFGLLQAHHRFL